MRFHSLAGLVLLLGATVAIAAGSDVYTTADTDIGDLIDDPAARAVLEKHLPGFTTRDRIRLARAMTLHSIQHYIPDELTEERLKAMDADLARLPARR